MAQDYSFANNFRRAKLIVLHLPEGIGTLTLNFRDTSPLIQPPFNTIVPTILLTPAQQTPLEYLERQYS